MHHYLPILDDTQLKLLEKQQLFHGLDREEIRAFLTFANPKYVRLFPDHPQRVGPGLCETIGLLLSGTTAVYSIDSEGNRIMLKTVDMGGNTGTLYSILDFANTLIELDSRTEGLLLLLMPETLFETHPQLAAVQHKLLRNLVHTQQELFTDMSVHIEILSQRTIRSKVTRFLQTCVRKYGGTEFSVPFTRDELAVYLAVDRASLSRSLSEMKEQGVIDFRKNHFRVLDDTLIR